MSFRDDFVWGAATASYQVEGAAFEDGKGANIWDTFSHTPGKIADKSTGDIACDHYYKYREDVQLMAKIGIKAYRFSLSWSRLLPEGTGKINQKGIDFYNALIDELLAYGIEPYVTLYHWDLPQALQDKGGWQNEESPEWFEEYATLVARSFGDRVRFFTTFNEPQVFMGCGYLVGEHAPGLQLEDESLLKACLNVLKAHGRAAQVLHKYVVEARVGITVATTMTIPRTSEDVESARKKFFETGKGNYVFMQSFWLDPIILGKFPEELQKVYSHVLASVTPGEMALISHSIDFLGVNNYTSHLVGTDEMGEPVILDRPRGFSKTAIGWYVTPEGIYWGTKFFQERYGLPIYITENGMANRDVVSMDGKVHDPQRIDFLHRYLIMLKKAAREGVDLRGYFQWSLMDNFEWALGYDQRFGIVYVDYETLQRTIKDSGYWYRDVIFQNGENL